jgi:hypothetical protein
VKLEKQKLILLLLFMVMALLLVFLTVHDPYAERMRADDFMGLLLSRMGLAPLGSIF